MRVVLHVGTESPGSYALQRALPLDADRLTEAGVVVPEAGRPVPHVAKMAIGWKKPDQAAWNELAAELEGVKRRRTVALSHEGLWSESKRALLRLRGLLKNVRELSVVLYLRDQADYLSWRVIDAQRHASQRFDISDRKALDAYVRRIELDYLSAAQSLARIFGPDALVVVPDTTGRRGDHDEVTDFYRRLGLDGPGPEAAALQSDLLLTPGLAAALRRCVKDAPERREDLLDMALRLSVQGVGVRRVFSPHEVKAIRQRHEVVNAQLSDLFLGGRRIEPIRPDTGLADHRSVDELRELLVEQADAAPLLHGDWLRRPVLESGPFVEGWQFREVAPVTPSPFVARLDGPAGTIRFRVPYRPGLGGGPDDDQLHLETEHHRRFPCEIAVNGESRGTIDVANDVWLPLGPDHKGLGVYEVDVRPMLDQPLEISSIGLRQADPVPA